MRHRDFKDAIEDARGVVALFKSQSLPEDDCLPAVREAVDRLDVVLEAALDRSVEGRLTASDRQIIEEHMRELLLLWSKCGHKTQEFMLDIKTLFGRYITVG